MVCTSFFVEFARGNGTFLLAHLVGMYVLTNKITGKKFLTGVALFLLLVGLGSVLNAFRYGKGFEYLFLQSENYGLSYLSESYFLVLLVPVLAYTCLPIVNLNLKLINLPEISIRLFTQGYNTIFYKRQDI